MYVCISVFPRKRARALINFEVIKNPAFIEAGAY